MGVDDSPLRDRVIFVEGAPRSGTTFFVTLLASHPQIAGVEAESHLFDFGVDRLFDNYEGRHEAIRGLNSFIPNRARLVDLARELCDGVLLGMRSHVRGGEDADYVVEKTPIRPELGRLDLERKRECFPDAWYLHIVRGGEDVARSLQRAPWLRDHSVAAGREQWSEAVGAIRETLGELPRYQEVSYEHLRDDPVATTGEIFRLLGVRFGEGVEATVRVLAKERFSDLGAVRPGAGGGRRRSPRRALRSAAAGARTRVVDLRRRRRSAESPPEGDAVSFELVRALREHDDAGLAAVTTEDFSLAFRSPEGDLVASGREACTALMALAAAIFDRRHVGEWWASSGAGDGAWWTSAPGKPFLAILLSAVGGDASRVDLSLGASVRDGKITRIVAITAGPLRGRPLREIGVGRLIQPDQTAAPTSR